MIKDSIIACLLILFINHSTFSQNKAKSLDSLFTSIFDEGKFNGNILIAENGKTIYQKSFGIANENTKALLDANSIFELQSVSKPITALAIAVLKEQGKLDFDDSIEKYFPELVQYYKNITIRNLLNHTNGLPDYNEEPLLSALNQAEIATNKDVLNALIKHHPAAIFEPNGDYKYYGTGYALLGLIIEMVSNQTYAEFLSNQFFKPLGMKNTFVYNRRQTPRDVKNYAFGYIHDSSGKLILPDLLPETKSIIFFDGIIGGRGVNSTTGDLLILDRALKSNKIVSQQTLDELYTPATLSSGKKTQYGLGWRVENNEGYGKIVRHSGSNIGHSTYFERHLSSDKTIIILQNHDIELVVTPIEKIREILYRKY